LDTSAFIAGFDPFSASVEQVTTLSVEREVKRNPLTLLRFDMAVESGKLKFRAPTKESLEQVKTCAASVGDVFYLSQTDIDVLALAMEAKTAGDNPQIVTDDYSIQNVATKLGLSYVALATFGIKRVLVWIRYCPACHRTYPPEGKAKVCSVCGTELKRKPQRETKPTPRKSH
jgi:endoribonuclease Nob1